MKGLLFGWFFGVLKIWISISLINLKWVESSKALSKESNGRLYLRQLPASFSSDDVCIFETRNLRAGPQGLLLIHKKRSCFLCCSKKRKLLQDNSKQSSSMTSFAYFLSSLDSFLVLGIMPSMSSIRYLNLPEIPREQATRVRCLFFHSFDAGSGSLNALNSSSSSTSYFSSYSSFSELSSYLLSGWVGY